MATNFAIGFKGITDWRIDNIEALTEADAFCICEDRKVIKDHTVYFVDFGGYFGYSALVFRNGHHIFYANDYSLHHTGRSRDWLRAWYIDTMTNKLFADSEFSQPLKDYSEYDRKQYFLRNYYPMQVDYVSIFAINPSEEERKEYKRKTAKMHYNELSFCYMSDLSFIEKQRRLFDALEAQKADTENNFEYQKDAFLREMYNHEYGINWEADHDTLSAFGNVGWHGDDLNAYFAELGFTDAQKSAYLAARRQYFEETRDNF